MSKTTESKRRPRAPLTRQRALGAAVALADADGIASLTMRRLAQTLDVEAMSLYHHVANKDDILDGMIDVVFSEIELPPLDVEWKTAMRRRAASLRAALTRHPWSISLMDSRASPGPATLRHLDAVIACCQQAGFSVTMTAHAFSLIDSYVFGFVLQEVNLPFTADDNIAAVFADVMSGVVLESYPHLAQFTADHVLQPGYRYSDEFDYGLDLILDGLDRSR